MKELKKIKNYRHINLDISKFNKLKKIFLKYNKNIELVIHCAAQPSHDWAAKQPSLDFKTNTIGTFNMLELSRLYCPETTFIFTSTNKVYGDRPNQFQYLEKDLRYDLKKNNFF